MSQDGHNDESSPDEVADFATRPPPPGHNPEDIHAIHEQRTTVAELSDSLIESLKAGKPVSFHDIELQRSLRAKAPDAHAAAGPPPVAAPIQDSAPPSSPVVTTAPPSAPATVEAQTSPRASAQAAVGAPTIDESRFVDAAPTAAAAQAVAGADGAAPGTDRRGTELSAPPNEPSAPPSEPSAPPSELSLPETKLESTASPQPGRSRSRVGLLIAVALFCVLIAVGLRLGLIQPLLRRL